MCSPTSTASTLFVNNMGHSWIHKCNVEVLQALNVYGIESVGAFNTFSPRPAARSERFLKYL